MIRRWFTSTRPRWPVPSRRPASQERMYSSRPRSPSADLLFRILEHVEGRRPAPMRRYLPTFLIESFPPRIRLNPRRLLSPCSETKWIRARPGCEFVSSAVKKDLKDLNTSVLDLVLIHGPIGTSGMCSSAWKTLEGFVSAGSVRSIGVSNFKVTLPRPLDTMHLIPRAHRCCAHANLVNL